MSNVTANGQRDIIVLLLGAALIASCVAVAHFAPDTFRATFIQMRVLTALGGALLGTALPGLIGIEFKGVRAIGAASFVVLFFVFTPLDLAAKQVPTAQTETTVEAATDVAPTPAALLAPAAVAPAAVTPAPAPAPAELAPTTKEDKARYENSPVCRGDNCQQNTTFNQQRSAGER